MNDCKGALPVNWEIAYSEQGEKYFIDHNTGTTQWEDPRDLPEGWERIDDRVYGTFYVDHINKKTQYERPQSMNYSTSALVNDSLLQGTQASLINGRDERLPLISDSSPPNSLPIALNTTNLDSNHSSPSHLKQSSSTMFTRDPAQLQGELLVTRIVKGPKGLGFTLIGNDGSSSHDEFLQVKHVIPGGPAHHNGLLRPCDILVRVNDECVLGATQAQACRIFQSINVGEMVDLEVCRGYQLMIDPTKKILVENAYNPSRSQDEREIHIKKGDDGFGFTIFESMQGQRIKKILYPERCENLLEGDTLLEMRTSFPHGTFNDVSPNRFEHVVDFRGMPHHQVVSILRDCPVGFWARLLVRRNSPRHRSKTPTAGFRFGEQRATPAPSLNPRSKTPLPVQPRPGRMRPSVSPSAYSMQLNSQPQMNGNAGGYFRNTIPRQCGKKADNFSDMYTNLRPSSTSLGFATPNYIPLSSFYNDSVETITANLIRKPSGFGFRIVGGLEEGTPITIGQIVPGGAAAEDGRLQRGDEIIEIDGTNVVGEAHSTAVQLTQKAATNGYVKLIIRRISDLPRSASMPTNHLEMMLSTYDVVLTRGENDGFGFVIISSATKAGSTIGKIMEGSAAAKCGHLMVGDRVLAVNGIDITNLPHNEIVNLIKDSGLSVRLTISPSLQSSQNSNGKMYSQGTTSSLNRLFGDNESPPAFGQLSSSYEPNFYRNLEMNRPPTNTHSAIPPELDTLIPLQLHRSSKGFGFSIRGGQEFGMPLFILRIAEDGPAAHDGQLKVGDQLVQVNGEPTIGMTHSTAIQLIKQRPVVNLLVRRPKNY